MDLSNLTVWCHPGPLKSYNVSLWSKGFSLIPQVVSHATDATSRDSMIHKLLSQLMHLSSAQFLGHHSHSSLWNCIMQGLCCHTPTSLRSIVTQLFVILWRHYFPSWSITLCTLYLFLKCSFQTQHANTIHLSTLSQLSILPRNLYVTGTVISHIML